VDDHLRTSDPDIYAIGEVALYGGMIYGLVAPGYEMAEIAAANVAGQTRLFKGADMSTKLKLMGVDVASFGNCFADEKTAKAITYEDPFKGTYKKLLFNHEGTRLLGGILVGDASEYGTLSMLAKSDQPLPMAPGELLLGKPASGGAGPGLIEGCQGLTGFGIDLEGFQRPCGSDPQGSVAEGDSAAVNGFGLDLLDDGAVLIPDLEDLVGIDLVENPQAVGRVLQIVGSLAGSAKCLFQALGNNRQIVLHVGGECPAWQQGQADRASHKTAPRNIAEFSHDASF
jgi:hypothetical protein